MRCPTCKQESKDLTTCEHCGVQFSLAVEPAPLVATTNDHSNGVVVEELAINSKKDEQSGAVEEGEAKAKEQANPLLEQPTESELPKPPPPSNEPTDRAKKGQAAKTSKHRIDDSVIGQYAVVDGDNNILVRTVNNSFQLVENRRPLKTFIELTSELPAFTQEYPASLFENLVSHLEALERQRIVVVSCYDNDLSLAASHILLTRLSLTANDQRRTLNFQQILPEDGYPNIFRAIEPINEPEQTVAVQVDATSVSSQEFLDTLLSTVTTAPPLIMSGLLRNKLYLICIADAERIDSTLKNPRKQLPFRHWRIPFLQTALRLHFPQQTAELEKVIQSQRRMGKWSKDEAEFCSEINGLLKSAQLEKAIESKKSGETEGIAPIFSGNDSVEDTVLYAATYFTNLKPVEFDRVVTTLLGNRTTTINQTSLERSADGVTREVVVSHEKALVDIWRQSADKILKECSIITTSDAGVIAFANHKAKDDLRECLERENSFFLTNRFREVVGEGLMFDRSEPTAENARRLLREMMISNPETYGIAWVLELIREIESCFQCTDGNPGPPDKLPRALGTSANKELVYKRLSQLVRDLLADDNLAEKVDALFRDLLAARLHRSSLELIKVLRFTSDSREFGWLRNLIDQSDQETSLAAYLYLYRELRKINFGAYDFLERLQAWLPAEDRKDETYSLSNRAALRLLVDLSLETTVGFRHDQYGLWPVRHPLLASDDESLAARRFELLARWLFHPGLDRVFLAINPGETVIHLLGALIAEWAFIIVGPPKNSTSSERLQQPPGDLAAAHSTMGPRNLLNQLIRQVVTHTSTGQRKQYQKSLIDYWEAYKELLLTLSSIVDSFDPQQRREFNWKRNVLKEMLSSFRTFQREQQSLQVD